MKSPLENAVGQLILGGKLFVDNLKSTILENNKSREIPKIHRYVNRPSLEEIFQAVITKEQRNNKIIESHKNYGYKLSEIGKHLKLHYTTMSRIFNSK